MNIHRPGGFGNHSTAALKVGGIQSRYDEHAAWLRSSGCCTFLKRSVEYLKKPGCYVDAQVVAHYLMGKVGAHRLPVELKACAGAWLSREMKSEFHDLLRTERYFREEPLGKTNAKLQFVLDKALESNLIHGSLLRPEDFVEMQAENWWSCEGVDPDYRASVTCIFVQRYLRGKQDFGDEFKAALHQCLADQNYENVGGWLRALLAENAELAKEPRFQALLEGYLGALQSSRTRHNLFEDESVDGLIRDLFPQSSGHGSTEMLPVQQALLDRMSALVPHMSQRMLSEIALGKCGEPLKRALFRSIPCWTNGVGSALTSLRLAWGRFDAIDQCNLLKGIASLVAQGKVQRVDHLLFLAEGFDRGLVRAEHVEQGPGFFGRLFEAAGLPMLNFMLNNLGYFQAGYDVLELAEVFRDTLMEPPNAKQLDEMVEHDLRAAIEVAQLQPLDHATFRSMAGVLKGREYMTFVTRTLEKHVAKVFDDFRVPRDVDLEMRIVETLANYMSPQLDSRGVVSAVRSLLGTLEDQGVDTPLLADALGQKTGYDALKGISWTSANDQDTKAKVFTVFHSFINWEQRKAQKLDDALQEIQHKFKDADDLMHGAVTSGEFANYVFSTLPYRSLNQVRSLMSCQGLAESLNSVLQALCESFEPYLDPDDPCGVLFAGHAPSMGGVQGAAQFIRVSDISLLMSSAVSVGNVHHFHMRSDGNDRPLSRDDLSSTALPLRLWEALERALPPKVLAGQGLEQLLTTLVELAGKHLSSNETGLIKGAIQKALNPMHDFVSNPVTKFATRDKLMDKDFERVLMDLNFKLKLLPDKGLYAAIIASKDVPQVGLLDKIVNEFHAACPDAELASIYYMFGTLLARLSSSDGLGWEINSEGYAQLGVENNQSIVCLRLWAAYCLSQCRDLSTVREAGDTLEELDHLIGRLVRGSTCANILSAQLHGKAVSPRLQKFSLETERLLGIQPAGAKKPRRLEMPFMDPEGPPTSFMVVNQTNNLQAPADSLVLIQYVRGQSRLHATP